MALAVVTPKGWLAVSGLLLVFATVMVWEFLGSIPIHVSGAGILLSTAGLRRVSAHHGGHVEALLVHSGQTVRRGQIVARLSSAASPPLLGVAEDVPSPVDGQVVEVYAAAGDLLSAGTPLALLEPRDPQRQELEAVLYVPGSDAKQLRPGMPAAISLSTVKREEYGALRGEVAQVAAFPASIQGMLVTLGNPELVAALRARSELPFEVRVRLHRSHATASGYEWTSVQGPPVQVQTGTLCRGAVTVRQRVPITVLVPLLRERVGL